MRVTQRHNSPQCIRTRGGSRKVGRERLVQRRYGVGHRLLPISPVCRHHVQAAALQHHHHGAEGLVLERVVLAPHGADAVHQLLPCARGGCGRGCGRGCGCGRTAMQATHSSLSSGERFSRPWQATAMTTSPPMKDGAIAPSTSSLCSALRLGSGTARRVALLISAAAAASFVQPAALNMMAWANPIFHRSAVVRHLGKAKSHGSSSPGGASSGLGASRGIA